MCSVCLSKYLQRRLAMSKRAAAALFAATNRKLVRPVRVAVATLPVLGLFMNGAVNVNHHVDRGMSAEVELGLLSNFPLELLVELLDLLDAQGVMALSGTCRSG